MYHYPGSVLQGNLHCLQCNAMCKSIAYVSLSRVSVAEKIEDDRENVRAFLALLNTPIMIFVTVMMMKGNYTHTVLVTMMRSVIVKCVLE